MACDVCLCKHGKWNEEPHMVMQTWRFDLDAKDEVSSFQPPTKVPRKENNHGFL